VGRSRLRVAQTLPSKFYGFLLFRLTLVNADNQYYRNLQQACSTLGLIVPSLQRANEWRDRKTRLTMTMPKRLLLIGTPLMFFLLVGGLHAAPKKPAKCGQPPTGMAAFFQKIGFAAKSKPCETVTPSGILGEQCADPGRHCSGPDGPGKCNSVFDAATNVWSCVCLSRNAPQ
jgi:hypothetical protein